MSRTLNLKKGERVTCDCDPMCK